MPIWLIYLGYITLAVMMVMFLASAVMTVTIFAVVVFREVLADRVKRAKGCADG